MPVCDTLLRLAEAGFFIPKWSPDILWEVARVLQKFGKPPEQIAHREKQMNLAFEDALVVGYETLIDGMKNHPKDRHVLAAAVRAGADAIVTENLRDFPAESLAPFGIEAQNTDTFLMQQYNLAPDSFLEVLQEQAQERRLEYRQLIDLLTKVAPSLPGVISA